jgi:hypothetical protein
MGRVPSRRALAVDIIGSAAIGLVGLGLRLAYVLDFARAPIGRLPWVDGGAYWTRAQEVLDGAWLPARPFSQDPLFPYLLAGRPRDVEDRHRHLPGGKTDIIID